MKLDAADVMSYPRKLVEQIILGLYGPINEHLVKLAGFDFAPDLRKYFQRELRSWLRKIQTLRFKPNNRTGSFKFYFDLLYEYPFGGVEVQNMRLIMDQTAEDYEEAHPTKTAAEMVEWLRAFHTKLAERLQNGEDVLDLSPQ